MLQVELSHVGLQLTPGTEQHIDAGHTAVESSCAVDQFHGVDDCLRGARLSMSVAPGRVLNRDRPLGQAKARPRRAG